MTFTVEDLKTRLDKFLAAASRVSRSQVQRDIEAGLVTVNGVKQTETDFIVRVKDIVGYHQTRNPKTPNSQQSQSTPLKILYNNHGLLIIDKPPGLAVHPGAGFKGESLTSALLYSFKHIALVGEEGRPGIVHRLDKDTSGVMLVALTQDMYEYLKDAFLERKVNKEYLALVLGSLDVQHGQIDTPIGKSKTDFRKMTTKNMVEPKDSVTEYWVLETLPLPGGIDKVSLLRVKLHTGRTHQIRVHMSSIGHPLLGDSLYGGTKTQLSGLTRQFLHARKIEVRLPDGSWIEAESELPEDLRNVLNSLNSQMVNTL